MSHLRALAARGQHTTSRGELRDRCYTKTSQKSLKPATGPLKHSTILSTQYRNVQNDTEPEQAAETNQPALPKNSTNTHSRISETVTLASTQTAERISFLP